jgi:hypothetical protein
MEGPQERNGENLKEKSCFEKLDTGILLEGLEISPAIWIGGLRIKKSCHWQCLVLKIVNPGAAKGSGFNNRNPYSLAMYNRICPT